MHIFLFTFPITYSKKICAYCMPIGYAQKKSPVETGDLTKT